MLYHFGGNNGIGFAIPVAMVKDVVGKLVADGKVTRGYLGVAIADLDAESSKVYKRKEGGLVLDISADTPAAKGGLKPGDLITEFDGRVITGPEELIVAVRSRDVGQSVVVKYIRDGKSSQVTLILTAAK